MTTAAPVSIWRRLVGIVGVALTGAAFIVFLYAALTRQPPPGTENDRGLFVGFFGLLTAFGAYLAHVGFPGIWRASTRRLTSRSGLRHPIVHTMLFFVAGILLAAIVPGPAAILTSLVVLCVFVFANPILIATGPRWLLRALISAVCFILLLGGLVGTSEAISRQQFGDDAMVFLLPFMIYLVTLPASGLLRLTPWFKKRHQVA